MIRNVFRQTELAKPSSSVFTVLFSFAACSQSIAQNIGDIGFVASQDGGLNVRIGPSTKDAIAYVLRNGDRVKVLKKQGKWVRASYTTIASGGSICHE